MKSNECDILDQDIRTLYIFDVDDTLFETFARRGVMKDGKIIKYLEKYEAFAYQLQEGESFQPWKDGEFTDARLFYNTSKPIKPQIERLNKLIQHLPDHSKIILLTARNVFDDPLIFLNTLIINGLSTHDFTVMFADGMSHPRHRGGYAGINKKRIIDMLLVTGHYQRVMLIDDGIKNLVYFYSLQLDYPEIEFFPYLAKMDGSIELQDFWHGENSAKVPTAYAK